MQIFGIISLLITVVIGVLWMTNTVKVPSDSEAPENILYGEAINKAEQAADLMSDQSVSDSDKKVFVYEGISVPTNIKTLDLSNKNLKGSLKAEVRHLTSVTELNISNNNFTGLPAEVGQLSELKVLNLSNNPLTGLPHELGNLKNLKTLDLRGTQYSEFDLEIIKTSLSPKTTILVD